MAEKRLGDKLENLLATVGITEDGINARLRAIGWVWGCGCRRRKERMNRLHELAEEAAKGAYNSVSDLRKRLSDLVSGK